ncbi:MAG: tyrosine-type recombinase/integrase, partial [Ruminococcus sp.]
FLSKLIFNVDQTKQEEELLSRVKVEKNSGIEEGRANLNFTKKELLKMPSQYRKFFKKEKNIRYREKTGVYEIRKRIDGVDYFASSKNRNEAVKKFIAKLQAKTIELAEETKEVQSENQTESISVLQNVPPQKQSPLFTHVCDRWLELRKPQIKSPTYKYYGQLFATNIYPPFIGHRIDEVKQSDVQKLINDYVAQEKYRTATKIYQALKAVFDFAVGEELIERSPMRLLRPPKYEEKNGCALTLSEERELVRLLAESKCAPEIKNALLFLLYTGIRRSELASARIEDGFVSVLCSKTRKGYQEKRRFIPITPMLERWLPGIELDELHTVRPDALTQAMKRLMPNHHLHELRHTFITRAQECGVPREVVSVWAGHAADNTQTSNVYTHFSREFMLNEAKKVDYNI